MNAVLTVAEIASRLRVSRDAVYGWVRSGKLPGVIRIAGTVRVDEHVLDEFLRAGGGLGKTALSATRKTPPIRAVSGEV